MPSYPLRRSKSPRRAGWLVRPQRFTALNRWPLLIEVVLLLGLTGVAAVAFQRSLRAGTVYDEGVYLASLYDLEHGQKLGSEVFSSQAPGFYVLLAAERAIFGGSVVAIRLGMLVVALVACISAYYIGRCVAGPGAGFLAMALLVAPLQVEDAAVRIRADLPSVALSLMAIAFALLAVYRAGAARLIAATLAGAALAAAVSVKLLAFTAVLPVLAIVLRGPPRRLVLALGAGAAAVVCALVGAYATVLGPLWSEVIRFHLKAQSASVPGAPQALRGNLAEVVRTLGDSHGLLSPFPWLVLAGAVGSALAWRRRHLLDALPLWLWVAVSAAFLIWHKPLWAHDVIMLTASLAVAAGIGLAALLSESWLASRMVGGACVVVVAATVAHHLQRTSGGESAGIRWAAAVIRTRTSEHDLIASDIPIIPFLADRREPATLVDTSTTRLAAGWLTRGEILRSIQQDHVGAVVIGHNFASDPQLVRAVRARYPLVVSRNGVRIAGERPRVLRIYLRAISVEERRERNRSRKPRLS